MSRSSFPPAFVLPCFAFPSVGPLGLGSPPSQALSFPAFRYYAPLRLPAIRLWRSARRFALRYLAFSPSLLCVPSFSARCEAGLLPLSARSLFHRATYSPVSSARRQLALPSYRVTLWCMPCSRTPVVFLALALPRLELLPSVLVTTSAFPPSDWWLSSVHDILHFGASLHGLLPHLPRPRTHHY